MKHSATKDIGAYTQVEAGVEVYSLPPLTAVDQAAVKEAQTLAPPDTGARIDLALERGFGKSAKNPATESGSKATAGNDSSAVAADAIPQSSQVGATAETIPEADAGSEAVSATAGDPVPTTPRKPPTLYGPDEPHQPK